MKLRQFQVLDKPQKRKTNNSNSRTATLNTPRLYLLYNDFSTSQTAIVCSFISPQYWVSLSSLMSTAHTHNTNCVSFNVHLGLGRRRTTTTAREGGKMQRMSLHKWLSGFYRQARAISWKLDSCMMQKIAKTKKQIVNVTPAECMLERLQQRLQKGFN